MFLGSPGASAGKESACSAGDLGSIPGLGRSPGGGLGKPLQYSGLENPHGQKSLVGYSPWGRKELEMTKRQIYDIAYLWNLKNGFKWTYLQNRLIDLENKLWLPEGKGGEAIHLEIGIDIETLLYIKQITDKNLLYSTGNFTQYSEITYMGK